MQKARATPHIEYYGLSFVGRREHNEDSIATLQIGPSGYFLAVADGMGGTAGGEVASARVLECVQQLLAHDDYRKIPNVNLKKVMRKVYEVSQTAVRKAKAQDPELQGMGTTLASVLISGSNFVVGNIGDSRVYLLREGTLAQLTEDQTYIRQMIRETNKRPEPHVISQYAHYLTHSIDGGKDVPDILPVRESSYELEDGDALFLCSDGLIVDRLQDDASHLAAYLTSTKTLRQAAEQLIAAAFYAGSTDNISVVVATKGKLPRRRTQIVKRAYPPRLGKDPVAAELEIAEQGPKVYRRERSKFKISLLAGIMLVLLAGAAYFSGAYQILLDTGTSKHRTQEIIPSQPRRAISESEIRPQGDSGIPPTEQTTPRWDAFRGFNQTAYTISQESFAWHEYTPSTKVKHYEVEIGERKLSRVTENHIELKTKGLRPGVYQVRISALLLNDTLISGGERKIHFKE